MRRLAITILGFAVLVVPLLSQNTPGNRAGGDAQILNAEEVLAVLNVAATALGNDTMAAAVVDRTGAYLNQSGIVWFPGSVPLYKNGRLVGGFGVSGDGVEQDDYVSQLGSEGFHPPDALRVDNSVIRNSKGEVVRLPYLKLSRHPEFDK